MGTAPQQITLTPPEDTLEEVVVQSNPFKTTKETPLSTQTFSAVEIEAYPEGTMISLRWYKMCRDILLLRLSE